LTKCLDVPYLMISWTEGHISDVTLPKMMYNRCWCEFERLARENDVYVIERLFMYYTSQSRSKSALISTLKVVRSKVITKRKVQFLQIVSSIFHKHVYTFSYIVYTFLHVYTFSYRYMIAYKKIRDSEELKYNINNVHIAKIF